MIKQKEQSQDMEQLRAEIRMNLEAIIHDMDCSFYGVKEKIGAMTGVGVGGTSSLGIMALLGESASLAGIKVGFGVAGSLVGGTLAAGAMIACIPLAIGGLSGYFIMRIQKTKNQKKIIANSLDVLYKMLDKTSIDSLFFKKEIELITAFIDMLQDDSRKILAQKE